MKNNPPDSQDDETFDAERLSPELAAFESRLRSLKPVAAKLEPPRPKRRKRRILLLAGGLTVAAALSLLIALTLFAPRLDHGPAPAPEIQRHFVSDDKIPHRATDHAIAEHKPDTEETQSNEMRPGAYREPLTMRRQLAMMLREMRPETDAVIEPKRPDYPVMVITVGQETRPLSPEAKQAFRRRMQSQTDPDAIPPVGYGERSGYM